MFNYKEYFTEEKAYIWKDDIYICKPCSYCKQMKATVSCSYGVDDAFMLVNVKTNECVPMCMFIDGAYDFREVKPCPVVDLAQLILDKVTKDLKDNEEKT